ncbi:MAG: flagellin [Oscillospiraceae bacterium]
MRITNSTILRGYNRNLNRLSTAKNASENKILTGRSFARASEAPLAAAKALNVRKSLYDAAQYKENLEVSDKFYTEAETSMLQVSEQLAGIRETIIAAVNSTKDKATDLNIYAQQLQTKADELVSIFNTDTAGRVIFGGESNNPMPFEIEENNGNYTVLYHGVPVNAYDDSGSFPYSKDVYVDIGLGLQMDEDTREVDPQSALRVSFNGAKVTGCGTEDGRADIDLSSVVNGRNYCIDVYAENVKKTIEFKGGTNDAATVANIQAALDKAYMDTGVSPRISDTGVISSYNGTVQITNNRNVDPKKVASLTYENISGYSNKYKLDLASTVSGEEYSLNITIDGTKKTVSFTSTGDESADRKALQNEIDKAFKGLSVSIDEDGIISAEGHDITVAGIATADGKSVPYEREYTYSNNYIQLTLDAAKALRDGNIEYANGCIDRIVSASENILVEIADMGSNEEFIEFSINRLETRELNLSERQKTLEATNLEEEITLMKTYEALYNACLQMSSSVVPNSIFNYIS